MNKLVFKASEVSRVVEHTIAHKGNIMLIHDQGVYLMSSAEPLDKVDEQNNYVVYAHGCNPNTDADWYDVAHDLVGGDDFFITLPFAEAIKEQLDKGATEITLSINEKEVKLLDSKVSNLRACVKCGKLLKKQDKGDLCAKCSKETEQEEPTPTETEPTEQAPSEQPSETKVKPGQVIRDSFSKLVSEGKITNEVMSILTDTELTKTVLGIRYAFLKEFNAETPIKELTYVGGHARYTSKPIEVNGKQYLVTNDLYARTLPKFLEWTETLNK